MFDGADNEERKAANMRLYHFCAMRQEDSAGVLSYTDGTITSSADFGDAEQYAKLKRQIIEYINANGGSATEVVLLSLTLLGEATPNVQGDRRCAALSRSVQRAKRTGSTEGLENIGRSRKLN